MSASCALSLLVGRERRAIGGQSDISKHCSTAQPCPHNQTTISTGAKALFSLSPTAATCSAPKGSLPSEGCRSPLHFLVFGSCTFAPFLHSTMSESPCSVLLLTLVCLSTCSTSISAHRPAADNPLRDARDILSYFLSTMNLTDRRPQQGPLAVRREPPEYMLELYRRFTQDYTAAPSASVVRSFKNEGRALSYFNAAGISE